VGLAGTAASAGAEASEPAKARLKMRPSIFLLRSKDEPVPVHREVFDKASTGITCVRNFLPPLTPV